MKRVNKDSFAAYASPAAEIMKLENTGVLCSSSELKDLEKEDFDFDWEN